MGYSVCIQCKEMVSSYEKYCNTCSRNKKSNDGMFWRTHGYEFLSEPKRTEEIQKDQFTEEDYARMKTIEMNRFELAGQGANEFGNRKQRRRFAALNRK